MLKARVLLPDSGIKGKILQHLWTGNDILNMELYKPMMAWKQDGPEG